MLSVRENGGGGQTFTLSIAYPNCLQCFWEQWFSSNLYLPSVLTWISWTINHTIYMFCSSDFPINLLYIMSIIKWPKAFQRTYTWKNIFFINIWNFTKRGSEGEQIKPFLSQISMPTLNWEGGGGVTYWKTAEQMSRCREKLSSI